jgi:predicted GIY-YIG superfamily endonuclease
MKSSPRLDGLIDRGTPVLLAGASLWLWLNTPPVYGSAWTLVSCVVIVKLIEWRRATFNQNHALYRFYDDANRLLYVGITSAPRLRFDQHRAAKPWWEDIVVREVTWYPTRELLAAAEKSAIRRERPLYNVVHNGSRR